MVTVMQTFPVTLQTPEYAIKLTEQQYLELLETSEVQTDLRADFITSGGWHHAPISFSAPVIERHYPEHRYYPESITFYGRRKMGKLQEDGYCLRGTVSVGGKKRTGWTSDIMVELPDGKLCSIAVIALHSA